MIAIDWPTTFVAATMIEPLAFGSTCRTRTRRPEAPDACAASTYSLIRSDATPALTTRATPVHMSAMSQSPSWIGVSGSFDQTARTMSTAIAGTATTTRVVQPTTSSTQPP